MVSYLYGFVFKFGRIISIMCEHNMYIGEDMGISQKNNAQIYRYSIRKLYFKACS